MQSLHEKYNLDSNQNNFPGCKKFPIDNDIQCELKNKGTKIESLISQTQKEK